MHVAWFSMHWCNVHVTCVLCTFKYVQCVCMCDLWWGGPQLLGMEAHFHSQDSQSLSSRSSDLVLTEGPSLSQAAHRS